MSEDDQSEASRRQEALFRLAVVAGSIAGAGMIILAAIAEVHFIIKFW